MNSTWHLVISLIKSVIRILSAVIAIIKGNWIIFAVGIALAEVLGILEELRDMR